MCYVIKIKEIDKDYERYYCKIFIDKNRNPIALGSNSLTFDVRRFKDKVSVEGVISHIINECINVTGCNIIKI